MIVVDASVWVAALFPQDAHHGSSDRWLAGWGLAGGTVIAPVLVVPEVASAIARRAGHARLGHAAVRYLLGDPTLRLVALDAGLAEDAATLAADQGIRGADAVYVALARREGVPLVTWDQEQLARARAVVATHTPDNAPTAP